MVADVAAKKRYEANKATADEIARKTGMPFSRFRTGFVPYQGRPGAGDRVRVRRPGDWRYHRRRCHVGDRGFRWRDLADPLEGINYGRCKAKVLRGEQGEIIIHSFAHGGAVYRLFHSEASLSKLVAGLPKRNPFLSVFADAMQDLMAGEQAYERLRQMAIDHTGGKAKPVNKALENAKAARSKAKAAKAARRAMALAMTIGS